MTAVIAPATYVMAAARSTAPAASASVRIDDASLLQGNDRATGGV